MSTLELKESPTTAGDAIETVTQMIFLTQPEIARRLKTGITPDFEKQ